MLQCNRLHVKRVSTYIKNFVLYHAGTEPEIIEINLEISTIPVSKDMAKAWHELYLSQFVGYAPEKVDQFFGQLERTNHAINDH